MFALVTIHNKQHQPLMFHKRWRVNIFIFRKVLWSGLMKKLINLSSWVVHKQGEVNNACSQAQNHEVMETLSSFIFYGHRSKFCKKKMWWDYTVPNPTGFLHFVHSQVLYSFFATSIQAAPGSYPSHHVPVVFWGIQEDPAFAWGTWNCTRDAFGCSALKIKIDKKDKNTTC